MTASDEREGRFADCEERQTRPTKRRQGQGAEARCRAASDAVRVTQTPTGCVSETQYKTHLGRTATVTPKANQASKGAQRPKRGQQRWKPSRRHRGGSGGLGPPGRHSDIVGAGEGRSPSSPNKWRTPAPGGGTRGSEGISTGADRGCVSTSIVARLGWLGEWRAGNFPVWCHFGGWVTLVRLGSSPVVPIALR